MLSALFKLSGVSKEKKERNGHESEKEHIGGRGSYILETWGKYNPDTLYINLKMSKKIVNSNKRKSSIQSFENCPECEIMKIRKNIFTMEKANEKDYIQEECRTLNIKASERS